MIFARINFSFDTNAFLMEKLAAKFSDFIIKHNGKLMEASGKIEKC